MALYWQLCSKHKILSSVGIFSNVIGAINSSSSQGDWNIKGYIHLGLSSFQVWTASQSPWVANTAAQGLTKWASTVIVYGPLVLSILALFLFSLLLWNGAFNTFQRIPLFLKGQFRVQDPEDSLSEFTLAKVHSSFSLWIHIWVLHFSA